MNLPNMISLARLFAAPVTVWLMLTGEMTVAFWLFLAASVSDAVDGFIAKRFDRETMLGGYLDPLADKALLVSVYITLGVLDHLALWLVILVVFRDILIIGGVLLLWLLARSFTIQPLMISKVNTVAQIVLATVVLGDLGLDLVTDGLVQVLIYAVAATTLASGATYLVEWTRRASRVETPE
ncbi:MAG: CDP-alcohol phosphatidyltransferase family protein [Proteobacteria bacterium]|nr:CDP-alcohol phosphatidyltransferase family protein [Pseudomonadota bacterium]